MSSIFLIMGKVNTQREELSSQIIINFARNLTRQWKISLKRRELTAILKSTIMSLKSH